MFFEARSDGEAGMIAVARNVLKRYEIGFRKAKNICQVVRSYKQYSFLWDGVDHVIVKSEVELFNQTMKVAEHLIILASIDSLPPYSIGNCEGGATHYHRYDTLPRWAHKKHGSMEVECGRVGSHIFYNGI